MHTDIADAISLCEALWAGQSHQVSFVTPALACILAAKRMGCESLPVNLSTEAQRYAANTGLADILAHGSAHAGVLHHGGLRGVTYCPITQLSSHDQVDGCNAAINAVVRKQLGVAHPLVSSLGKVVGELHDNVPSHARGPGFSMAQVHERELKFAVADAGCGLLSNAQRATDGEVCTHRAAIEWCLKRGHTSAPRSTKDDLLGPQRVPEDVAAAHGWDQRLFDDGGNHHLGLGLYELMQFISATGGSCGVLSGDTLGYSEGSGQLLWKTLNGFFTGLAIFIVVDTIRHAPNSARNPVEQARISNLGKELGI